MKLNTLGSANGIFQSWEDGPSIANYADVVYVTPGHTNGSYSYNWSPTWGGGSAGMSAKSRDDYILLDQFYMSGVPR